MAPNEALIALAGMPPAEYDKHAARWLRSLQLAEFYHATEVAISYALVLVVSPDYAVRHTDRMVRRIERELRSLAGNKSHEAAMCARLCLDRNPSALLYYARSWPDYNVAIAAEVRILVKV